MQHKKNQMSVGLMVQRCHHWRQKRKQFMDTARTTADEIERERLLQAAEHYGRIVNEEQSKIDSKRDTPSTTDTSTKVDSLDDDDDEFQDFKNN